MRLEEKSLLSIYQYSHIFLNYSNLAGELIFCSSSPLYNDTSSVLLVTKEVAAQHVEY
jgi:hypothetical protein